MANYHTREIIDLLNEIVKDGYDIVDVTEIESDGDLPTRLSFSVYDAKHECGIDYDNVDSIDDYSD